MFGGCFEQKLDFEYDVIVWRDSESTDETKDILKKPSKNARILNGKL